MAFQAFQAEENLGFKFSTVFFSSHFFIQNINGFILLSTRLESRGKLVVV